MDIDWMLAGKIAGPVLLLVIGTLVKRAFERRAVLISYYIHTSSVVVTPPAGAQPFSVNTHGVALRNVGKLAATNVRLSHLILPSFTIWPPTQHSVETLPDSTKVIVIPRILPGEQLTITYLYFPPLLWNQINAGIRSDQGFARPIPATMQRQYSPLVIFLLQVVLLVGIGTLLYWLWLAGLALWRCASG